MLTIIFALTETQSSTGTWRIHLSDLYRPRTSQHERFVRLIPAKDAIAPVPKDWVCIAQLRAAPSKLHGIISYRNSKPSLRWFKSIVKLKGDKMSSTQKLQSNTSIAYRRVQQIKQCTPSALPDQIDHDASHAFSRFCEWVSNGGVEFVPGLDSYKTVVKLHQRLPEYLRERLDSVFAGLARGADTGRHYEGWFNEIEEEWRERMLNASLMS